METEIFQEFQKILCDRLHERIKRIRDNYSWIYLSIVDDMAKLAVASGMGATTEDEKISEQIRSEIEEEMSEYCQPILREHEEAIRKLVMWFNSTDNKASKHKVSRSAQR